jgi:hypothetical protein
MLATVAFGPSRSSRMPRAIEYARRNADARELGPGRFYATFALDPSDLPSFSRLAWFLEQMVGLRGVEVDVDGEPHAPHAVLRMAYSARGHLRAFGECRRPFTFGVPAECWACPLFDRARADSELVLSTGYSVQVAGQPEGWM